MYVKYDVTISEYVYLKAKSSRLLCVHSNHDNKWELNGNASTKKNTLANDWPGGKIARVKNAGALCEAP